MPFLIQEAGEIAHSIIANARASQSIYIDTDGFESRLIENTRAFASRERLAKRERDVKSNLFRTNLDVRSLRSTIFSDIFEISRNNHTIVLPFVKYSQCVIASLLKFNESGRNLHVESNSIFVLKKKKIKFFFGNCTKNYRGLIRCVLIQNIN